MSQYHSRPYLLQLFRDHGIQHPKEPDMSLVTIHRTTRRKERDGSTRRVAAVTESSGGRQRQVGELCQTDHDWQLTVFDPLDDSRYTVPVVHQQESDAHAFAQGYFLGYEHGKARIASQF